jgi:calcineurin-like phosphoesterase
MTGVSGDGSVIGMDSRLVTEKFIKGVPVRFEPARGAAELNGVILDLSDDKNDANANGLLKTREFKRIRVAL